VAVDADELEVVYEEHGARLWRALLLFSGDPEVASDAVAEAFAKVLWRGDSVHSPERWIWRSAFPHRGRVARSSRHRAAEPRRDRELTLQDSHLSPEPPEDETAR
jgi:DNA-directed RNA polymerase specialized sigma24 family protein